MNGNIFTCYWKECYDSKIKWIIEKSNLKYTTTKDGRRREEQSSSEKSLFCVLVTQNESKVVNWMMLSSKGREIRQFEEHKNGLTFRRAKATWKIMFKPWNRKRESQNNHIYHHFFIFSRPPHIINKIWFFSYFHIQ